MTILTISSRLKMIHEVRAAVDFISLYLIGVTGLKEMTDQYKCEEFGQNLFVAMINKFRDHWYPENSQRGQAYRCVRIEKLTQVLDPLLITALQTANLKFDISKWPQEMCLWIDPGEVSFQVVHCGQRSSQRIRQFIYPRPPPYYEAMVNRVKILHRFSRFPPDLSVPPPSINFPPPKIQDDRKEIARSFREADYPVLSKHSRI